MMQRLFLILIMLFSAGYALAEEENIVIANIAPFAGKQGIYGEQIRRGMNFAAEKINSSGGINNQKIKILSYDDACDPKEAEKMAKIIISSDGKLSPEKILLVVGHICMASTLMTIPIYYAADLIHFVPSYVDHLGELSNKKMFIMDSNIERRAGIASNFLKENFANHQIAILHDDNKNSQIMANFVHKNLEKISENEVYGAEFVSGINDYTGLIETLAKKAIDVVYLATSLYDAQNIINQMKNKNFKVVYLASNPLFGDGNFNPDFDGKILFSAMPDARYFPEAASVVSRFRVSGFEPKGFTLYGVAIVEAFAAAYQKAQNKTVLNLAEVLKNNEFETSVGKIGFNLAGEITGLLPTIYEWKNNSYQELFAENF